MNELNSKVNRRNLFYRWWSECKIVRPPAFLKLDTASVSSSRETCTSVEYKLFSLVGQMTTYPQTHPFASLKYGWLNAIAKTFNTSLVLNSNSVRKYAYTGSSVSGCLVCRASKVWKTWKKCHKASDKHKSKTGPKHYSSQSLAQRFNRAKRNESCLTFGSKPYQDFVYLRSKNYRIKTRRCSGIPMNYIDFQGSSTDHALAVLVQHHHETWLKKKFNEFFPLNFPTTRKVWSESTR